MVSKRSGGHASGRNAGLAVVGKASVEAADYLDRLVLVRVGYEQKCVVEGVAL